MRSFGADTRMPTVAAVLDLIRERRTVSRVELAEATGMTQATMTHAVRKLMAMGFVHEVGKARSSNGMPRRLVELVPEASYQVGIQFDRYTAVGVVIDLAGATVVRRDLPGAGDRHPEEVLLEYAGAVDTMLDAASIPREKVLGIGLATHGPQDRGKGVLLTPQPSPDWREFPLAARLQEATGLPVALENDATAAGIGVQAKADAASNFAVVFMSGGIGAGVIIDGHPYRGATSNGVELGHISVEARGPRCACGNRGCLDMISGPAGVTGQAMRNRSLISRLGLGKDTLTDFLAIGRAAASGDAEAEVLIDTSKQHLAIATITLVNLFDVGRVVLAGAAFAEFGDVYLDALQEDLDESVFMRHVHSVQVRLAENPADAPAVGAAMVVLRDLLESPGEFPTPAT
ncbi:ROK family transcriptional regulator [Glycomyces tenuis]|uniref:ROK family transcriptional regulator n=1 Tax=Glycomyces tenuis TaxID=58116 RepID=UPI00040F4AC7|nr:ROK family transcriptional regulator [Glycomyces tenuis]